MAAQAGLSAIPVQRCLNAWTVLTKRKALIASPQYGNHPGGYFRRWSWVFRVSGTRALGATEARLSAAGESPVHRSRPRCRGHRLSAAMSGRIGGVRMEAEDRPFPLDILNTQLTRRDVLKGALVAGAGVSLAPLLAACGSSSSPSSSASASSAPKQGGSLRDRHRRRLRQRDPRRPARDDRARDRDHVPALRRSARLGPELQAGQPAGRRGLPQRRRHRVDRQAAPGRRVPRRLAHDGRRRGLQLQAHHRSEEPQDGRDSALARSRPAASRRSTRPPYGSC